MATISTCSQCDRHGDVRRAAYSTRYYCRRFPCNLFRIVRSFIMRQMYDGRFAP